jgi:hypothetical protein
MHVDPNVGYGTDVTQFGLEARNAIGLQQLRFQQ